MDRKPSAADMVKALRMQHGAISTLLGQMLAMDAVVTTLIATHPDPELLRDVWLQLKPELVDGHLEGNPAMYADERFRETFHGELARYKQGIHMAAEPGE
jgi:hypothetical protein